MDAIRTVRERRRLSQRALARRAGLSFRGVQLLEAPGHDARVSSLEAVSRALGLPVAGLAALLRSFFLEDPDSFRSASLRMVVDGFPSWTIHLFDAVDSFRSRPDRSLVDAPPVGELDTRLGALVASTVETLCAEAGMDSPPWCRGVGPLAAPWFVSGIENHARLSITWNRMSSNW